MSVWQRQLRTDNLLWLVLSISLFVIGGFVNPMPDIKGSYSLWFVLGILLRRDYYCSHEEIAIAVVGRLVLLAVPAVLFGWVLQAILLVAKAACQRTNAGGQAAASEEPGA